MTGKEYSETSFAESVIIWLVIYSLSLKTGIVKHWNINFISWTASAWKKKQTHLRCHNNNEYKCNLQGISHYDMTITPSKQTLLNMGILLMNLTRP